MKRFLLKISSIILLTPLLTLTSCSSFSLAKPTDWNGDFWLKDLRDYDDLADFNKVKDTSPPSFGAPRFTYYNKKYGNDPNIDSIVFYYFTHEIVGPSDVKYLLYGINITDETINLYGLSLKSSLEEFKDTFISFGFEIIEEEGNYIELERELFNVKYTLNEKITLRYDFDYDFDDVY